MLNKQIVFEYIMEQAFDNHNEHCEGCSNYIVTPDAYGTGDSPTEYECGGTTSDCQAIEDFINNVRG